jgi:hypothetical protein
MSELPLLKRAAGPAHRDQMPQGVDTNVLQWPDQLEEPTMTERSFVVVINERALGSSVENIGKHLLALDGQGIHSAGRPIDAVLHDLLRGVRDNVLLKTTLEPVELETHLKKSLGGDYKLCTIRWMG